MNERIAEVITNKLLYDLKEERLTYIKISFYIETIISEIEKTILLIILFGIIGEIKSFVLIYMIAIFVRRYSGGNHCDTFLGCLVYSTISCVGIVLISKCIVYINNYFVILTLMLHVVIMILFAPIKSKFRPKLKGKDILEIKIKGLLGIVIVACIYLVIPKKYRIIIFLTLLFLLIDEIVACWLNYLKMKGVIRNEENGS
ncbi:MAG: accessory gene regulator B family protein [Lachnospiraceae bacterium]|nr:accessory gene regulator B family protein [Lachnospiraceae bacterium]